VKGRTKKGKFCDVVQKLYGSWAEGADTIQEERRILDDSRDSDQVA